MNIIKVHIIILFSLVCYYGFTQEDQSGASFAELESSYILLKNMNLQETAEFPVIAYGLADAYAREGQFKPAIEKMKEALEYEDHAKGVPDDFRSSIFLELSNYHSEISEIHQSIQYLIISIEEWEKLRGADNFTNFERNKLLGKRYRLINELDKSLERHQYSLKLLDGLDPFDYVLYYGIVRSHIANVLFDKGDFSNAMTNYREALDHYEQSGDTKNFIYSDILEKAANCLRFLGNFSHANQYYLQSLQIKRELGLDNDTYYLNGLFNYGRSLESMGHCQEALDIHLSTLELAEEFYAPDDSIWGNYYRSLSVDYKCIGDLKNAILYREKAIEIYDRNNEKDNPNYPSFLSGLALMYSQNGDSERAILMLEKSHELVKTMFGDKDLDFGIIAMNLGYLQNSTGNYEEAGEYYLMAEKNFKVSLNSDNITLADFYSNFASFHIEMGNYKEAEELIERGLDVIRLNSLGENHTAYDALQIVRSELLFNLNEIDQAIAVLTEVVSSIENKFGKDNPVLANHIFTLAKYYAVSGDLNKALQLFKRANGHYLEGLKRVFTYRSEAEKRIMVSSLKNWQSLYYSFLNSEAFLNDELISDIFNDHLIKKALLLNASKGVLGDLLSMQNPDIDKRIDEFNSLRRKLTIGMNGSLADEINDQESLKETINKLENELVNLHSEYFNDDDFFAKDWKEINQSLSPGEVVVDFIHYDRVLGDLQSVEERPVQYMAFLLRHEWDKPRIVPLFIEEELQELLESNSPDQLYASRGRVSRNVADVAGTYDLIWKSIEPYLDGIRTVYFSPAGLLNQVPFAALGPENGQLLSSKYNLVQLSNTYLITQKKNEPGFDRTVFIGGVDYDIDKHGRENDTNVNLDLNSINKSKGTRSIGESWSYLPGTLKEINAIEALFDKSRHDMTKWTGQEASEARFKAFSGNSPKLIHLATHGFFFENPEKRQMMTEDILNENKFKYAEDPLLRSGLILAGANQAWQHGINPFEEEDGVLTAMEIANMDLSNTDLVVLSACETGLGDIDGSEGVYGLQRAFKMAGVDLIIMSLWQVPDKETAEFMTLFYENWLGGKDVRAAFNNTQKTMQQRYKDEPLKWAAFVLME
ncbi:MAG: CHAT domain-containing protein [Bacteroidia bacterium]|nr:CHAT domain-containing protein [Bacteroidia bacterium]